MSRAAVLLLAVLLAAPAARAAPPALSNFAFHPHPGAQLPLGTALYDAEGHQVRLGQYFTGKPVVLVLDYTRCKTLCGVTLKSIVTSLDELSLDAGRDFQMVSISIDPRDRPADLTKAKTKYLADYRRHPDGAAGLHFLGGAPAAVRRIADTIGFPYWYDADVDQYIHPAGFVLAAPDGKISRYFEGIGAAPKALNVGLSEAAQGVALSPLTRLLLLCHISGAPFGRYTVPVIATITVTNILATILLFVIFAAIRRRRHR